MTAAHLLAWVDESQPRHHSDPIYLLAAVVCDPANVDEARAAMRGLLLRGQRKVHWRAEGLRRRLQIVETIAATGLLHIVVVRAGSEGEAAEKQRRRTLRRLLYELESFGVGTVTLESRGPKPDYYDYEMLDFLRIHHVVTDGLRMEHKAGPADPMLWVPDAVCGAVGRSIAAGEDRFRKVIDENLLVIDLDPGH